MIADLDQAPTERAIKPVWRVAFFGRLEERKGIKLFVDAVERLPAEARAPAEPRPRLC
jgi:glycosyltransferase involved in cell wall biosynthesis